MKVKFTLDDEIKEELVDIYILFNYIYEYKLEGYETIDGNLYFGNNSMDLESIEVFLGMLKAMATNEVYRNFEKE